MHLQTCLAWLPMLLTLDNVLTKSLPSYAGPFIAYAHRVRVCPSDGSIVLNVRTTYFNPAKPFELQSVWGNASLKMPFDDSSWAHVTMAVRNNNEWKENAFIFKFPGGACSAVRDHIPSVFNVMTKLAPELCDRKAPCAIRPGQYEIENGTIGWEFPKFKVIPYGHYLFTVKIGKGGPTPKMCLEVDCEAIPKPN